MLHDSKQLVRFVTHVRHVHFSFRDVDILWQSTLFNATLHDAPFCDVVSRYVAAPCWDNTLLLR
jgi:hypothetical protein